MPTAEDELKIAERVATKLVGTRPYQVREDQAVWERRIYVVDVPNDVKDDEVREYIIERLSSGEIEPTGNPKYTGNLESVDTQYDIAPV